MHVTPSFTFCFLNVFLGALVLHSCQWPPDQMRVHAPILHSLKAGPNPNNMLYSMILAVPSLCGGHYLPPMPHCSTTLCDKLLLLPLQGLPVL